MAGNIYIIEATVHRSVGQTRKIEWEYSGNGSGTSCWNAWRKMSKNHKTMDTQESFVAAALYLNGQRVERIGDWPQTQRKPEIGGRPINTVTAR